MIPVTQTIFGVDEATGIVGNCFASCIASIFEIPLEEIPHFCQGKNPNWFVDLVTWLEPRGHSAVFTAWNPEWQDAYLRDCFCIVGGPSPRGDFLHATVYRGIFPIHDPHPSRAFFAGEPQDVTFFVTQNPARRAI